MHTLARAGYDTISNLRELDTDEFLDLVEYHQIANAIERKRIEDKE